MIRYEFEKLIKEMKWNYTDANKEVIWLDVMDINIDYEEAKQISMKYRTTPNGLNLVRAMKELEKRNHYSFSAEMPAELYFVINKKMRYEAEYFQGAVQATLIHNFIMPQLITSTDNLFSYASDIVPDSSLFYELFWIYLQHQKYQIDMPKPEIRYDSIMEFYEIKE